MPHENSDDHASEPNAEATPAQRVTRRTVSVGSALSDLEFIIADCARSALAARPQDDRLSIEPFIDPRIFSTSESARRIAAPSEIRVVAREVGGPPPLPRTRPRSDFAFAPVDAPVTEPPPERVRHDGLRRVVQWAASGVAALVIGGAAGTVTRADRAVSHATRPSENRVARSAPAGSARAHSAAPPSRALVASIQPSATPALVSEARLALAGPQLNTARVHDAVIAGAFAVADARTSRRRVRMDHESDRVAVEQTAATPPAIIATPPGHVAPLETWGDDAPMRSPAPAQQVVVVRESQTPTVTAPSAALRCAQRCGNEVDCMAACAVAPQVPARRAQASQATDAQLPSSTLAPE